MTDVCRACGASARLGPDGVCAWAAGCEHRQLQAEASTARIEAAVDAWTGASEQRLTDQPIIPRSALDPYDADLRAFHERAWEAHGGPVCVHCVALAN